jgi:hypothetical protein
VTIHVDLFALTDAGLGRPNNEDAVLVVDLDHDTALPAERAVALDVEAFKRRLESVAAD